MKDVLITITGLNYRFGSDFLKKGMKVKLIKEPDNEHDKEAICVEFKGLGHIGYVANSAKTVMGECISANVIKLGLKQDPYWFLNWFLKTGRVFFVTNTCANIMISNFLGA